MRPLAIVMVLVVLAGAGCETQPGPDGAGPSPSASPSGAPPGLTGGPLPVEVCDLVDLEFIRAKGIAVRVQHWDTPDGGPFPSDVCPIFREGQSIAIGELRVAMTPVTAADFGRARVTLGGTAVAGIGDEAFVARRNRGGLYARRGDLVVSMKYSTAFSEADQVALIRTAFGRLPAPYRFVPHTWPRPCDKLGRDAAVELLGGPVIATRGYDPGGGGPICDLFASPGHVRVYFHRPYILDTAKLRRVPGIAAEVYLGDLQDAHVVVGGKEAAYIDLWLPEVDLKASKGGFAPLTPALAAFCQRVADAVPPT